MEAHLTQAPGYSHDYNFFLNRFCFYTGKDTSQPPPSIPRRMGSDTSDDPSARQLTGVEDYFDAANAGEDCETPRPASATSGHSTPTTPRACTPPPALELAAMA